MTRSALYDCCRYCLAVRIREDSFLGQGLFTYAGSTSKSGANGTCQLDADTDCPSPVNSNTFFSELLIYLLSCDIPCCLHSQSY